MARYKVYIASLMIVVMQLTTFHVAYASTATGGWNVSDAIMNGATATWNATKSSAGKVYNAVASMKLTPAQVAKGISRFGVGLFATAGVQALLDGVDYVLDPKNNSVTYKSNDYWVDPVDSKIHHKTLEEACNSGTVTATYGWTFDHIEGSAYCYYKKKSGALDYFLIYHQKATQKSVPISIVAQQLITDADNGDKEAQQKIATVANTAFTASTTSDDEIVPMSTIVSQFDSTSQLAQDEDDTKPSTATNTGSQSQTQDQAQDQSKPDESASNPTATPTPSNTSVPTDCQFFQTACTWFDWTKKQYTDTKTAVTEYFNLPQENDTVDIDQQNKDQNIDTNINFNGSCPSDFVLYQGDFLGISIDWKIQFSGFCTILTSYVRPVVILVGSYLAILIMGGRRDA